MNSKLIRFSSEAELYRTVTDGITTRSQKESLFRLAFSGGHTMMPVYEQLAHETRMSWSTTDIFLIDERYVPLIDSRSNYQSLHRTLIKNIQTLPHQFVFFDTRLPIPDALKTYDVYLDHHHNPFFDLLVLGMGEDGHVASLFPLTRDTPNEWVQHTITNTHEVRDRLTLTFSALASSREIFLLAVGKRKSSLLKSLHDPLCTRSSPAARILHLPQTKAFYTE